MLSFACSAAQSLRERYRFVQRFACSRCAILRNAIVLFSALLAPQRNLLRRTLSKSTGLLHTGLLHTGLHHSGARRHHTGCAAVAGLQICCNREPKATAKCPSDEEVQWTSIVFPHREIAQRSKQNGEQIHPTAGEEVLWTSIAFCGADCEQSEAKRRTKTPHINLMCGATVTAGGTRPSGTLQKICSHYFRTRIARITRMFSPTAQPAIAL